MAVFSFVDMFWGIKTHAALSLIVETGDFKRFAKGNIYAAHLGIAPGKNSSGLKTNRTGLFKVRNSHLIQLLVEAAGGICKGMVGHKSKDLRARQKGNTDDVIKYADKVNVRLRSRYNKFIRHGKVRNMTENTLVKEC